MIDFWLFYFIIYLFIFFLFFFRKLRWWINHLRTTGLYPPSDQALFYNSALRCFHRLLLRHTNYHPNEFYLLFFSLIQLSFGAISFFLTFLLFLIFYFFDKIFAKKTTFFTFCWKICQIKLHFSINFSQNLLFYMSLIKKNAISVYLVVWVKVIAFTNYGAKKWISVLWLSEHLSCFLRYYNAQTVETPHKWPHFGK